MFKRFASNVSNEKTFSTAIDSSSSYWNGFLSFRVVSPDFYRDEMAAWTTITLISHSILNVPFVGSPINVRIIVGVAVRVVFLTNPTRIESSTIFDSTNLLILSFASSKLNLVDTPVVSFFDFSDNFSKSKKKLK